MDTNNKDSADDGPTAKRPLVKKDSTYTYTRLGDLQEGIYNVYGVVRAFTPPRKCLRGGEDYILTVTIIDPSNLNGITINIFGPDESKLPQVNYEGDIFRAHRMKVNMFNGKLQGVGSHKAGFSFIVVNRVDGTLSGASKNMTFTASDKDHIAALKLWFETTVGLQNQLPQPSIPSHTLCNIEQVVPNMVNDVVAQVIRISPPEGSGTKTRVKLSVWDGTGQKISLSPEELDGFITEWTKNEPSRTQYSPSSPYGTLLTVVVWSQELVRWILSGKLAEGNWVYLKSMTSKLYEGHLEGKIGESSAIQLMANTAPNITTILEDYKSRCESYIQKYIQQRQQEVKLQILSKVTHETIPFSTIEQILNHPEPTFKFRCKVQVTGYVPSGIRNFTRPYCDHCHRCVDVNDKQVCLVCQNDVQRYVYYFQLKVQDETGSMNLIVFNEDAIVFLPAMPPVNLIQNNVSLGVLWKKITNLLDPTVRLDCCIKSYYLSNKPNERKYRIFDTALTI